MALRAAGSAPAPTLACVESRAIYPLSDIAPWRHHAAAWGNALYANSSSTGRARGILAARADFGMICRLIVSEHGRSVHAMHALILGGTGSAGRALLRQLQGARVPVDVSVVSRTATSLPGAATVLTGHYGDLACTGDLQRHLAGVDAVVHLADGLGVLQKPRFASDTSVADRLISASERLAAGVREAKVPLLVYVSSIKALCDEDDGRVLTETCASRATTLYGGAKLRLEQIMARVLAGSATSLAIVRNPAMYGPAKGGSVRRLLKLADSAIPLPLGGLTNRRSLLAIENFAGALAAIVRSPPATAAGIFHVHDGPALSTTEIVATLRAALGRPRRLLAVGAGGAALASRIPLLIPVARRLYRSLEISDAHFRQTFGWTPVIETKAALGEMAAAWRAERGLDAGRAAVPNGA
jgi:nucleoside-diphosphate-sugar epimerase